MYFDCLFPRGLLMLPVTSWKKPHVSWPPLNPGVATPSPFLERLAQMVMSLRLGLCQVKLLGCLL